MLGALMVPVSASFSAVSIIAALARVSKLVKTVVPQHCLR